MLISIVVPVYNVEQYIEKTIDSIINQTNKSFEVIFVNDGTLDNSVSVICNKMQNTSVPYQVVSQINSGLGVARNTGVLHAKGEWVVFLDSDDVLQDFAIETYVNIVAGNKLVDCVFSDFQVVDFENAFLKSETKFNAVEITKDKLLNGFLTRKMVFLVPGTLYRREFLEQNSIFHPDIRWSEDQYFMWLVLSKLTNAIVADVKLYNYVQHKGESIMKTTGLQKMLDAYKIYKDLPDKLNCKKLNKFLLARWCLGCLNVLSKRKDFNAYIDFWNAVDFSKKCKRLIKFPSLKVKMVAFCGLINKKLLYKILAKTN